MWDVNCRSSPHIWGMWMSPTLTGISKLFRSYFNWPPTAWERTGPEMNNERFRLPVAGSALFRRSLADTAGGEPAHDSGIPGHLPFVAPVRLQAPSTRTLPTSNRRYRCALLGEVPGTPRDNSRQQCPDAQQSFGGLARLLPIRSCQRARISVAMP